MDLTLVYDGYLGVLGEPIFAGILLTLTMTGIMIRLGASTDQILLIMLPFMFITASVIMPQSIMIIALLLSGVIMAIAVIKLFMR